MKKIYSAIALSLSLFACKKSATLNLAAILQPGQTDSAEIAGNWTLIATRHYDIPVNLDTSWRPQDTMQGKVVVGFGPDSTFTYNTNYSWKPQAYSRYSYLDSGYYANYPAFRIYSTQIPNANVANPHVFARLINPKTLIITYMGVDAGVEELYTATGLH